MYDQKVQQFPTYFRYYAIKKARKMKVLNIRQSFNLMDREIRTCDIQDVPCDVIDWYLMNKQRRFHGHGRARAMNCIRYAWGTWL